MPDISKINELILPSATMEITAKARELRASGKPVIGFGAGEPDFPTPSYIIDAAKEAVDKDYAESIILGCTAEFGFYKTLQEEIGVPVIDPSLAALKKAEHHANLKRKFNLIPSRKWSCESPTKKEIEKFNMFHDTEPLGNRIVIPAN